jgi:hypothetical protein
MPEALLTGLVRDAEYASAGPCQARLRSTIQTVSRRSISIVYPDGLTAILFGPGHPDSLRQPQGEVLGIHVERVVAACAMDPVRRSSRVRNQVHMGRIGVQLRKSPPVTRIDCAPASSARHPAVMVRPASQQRLAFPIEFRPVESLCSAALEVRFLCMRVRSA